MKLFFIFLILLTMSFSHSELITSAEMEKKGEEIQKQHQSWIGETSSFSHYFFWKMMGKKENDKIAINYFPYSVYQNTNSFSCYANLEGKITQIQCKNVKDSLLSLIIEWKTVSSVHALVEIHFKKETETKLNAEVVRVEVMNKQASNYYQPIQKTVLQYLSEVYDAITSKNQAQLVFVAQKIEAAINIYNWNPSTRDIVCKNGSFYVSYPNCDKYGNGKVTQFHLLIQSGTGALRHEIIGGYLFLTAIAGSWKGQYWIWQEEP